MIIEINLIEQKDNMWLGLIPNSNLGHVSKPNKAICLHLCKAMILSAVLEGASIPNSIAFVITEQALPKEEIKPEDTKPEEVKPEEKKDVPA